MSCHLFIPSGLLFILIPQEDVQKEVKVLLEAKAQYKNITGKDYAPPSDNKKKGGQEKSGKQNKKPENKMAPVSSAENSNPAAESLLKSISEQGEKVRKLKSASASKVRK